MNLDPGRGDKKIVADGRVEKSKALQEGLAELKMVKPKETYYYTGRCRGMINFAFSYFGPSLQLVEPRLYFWAGQHFV